jgi:hypothetical protein
LLDASIAAINLNREEILEPEDLRVWVSAGSAQHGGCAGPLHYFQLGAHVDGGEAMGDLVLWDKHKQQSKRDMSIHRITQMNLYCNLSSLK